MSINSKNKVENVTIEARIIRADGTIEELGEIASLKKGNVFINVFINAFKKLFKKA